jgi:hypothetical protein
MLWLNMACEKEVDVHGGGSVKVRMGDTRGPVAVVAPMMVMFGCFLLSAVMPCAGGGGGRGEGE